MYSSCNLLPFSPPLNAEVSQTEQSFAEGAALGVSHSARECTIPVRGEGTLRLRGSLLNVLLSTPARQHSCKQCQEGHKQNLGARCASPARAAPCQLHSECPWWH